MGRYREFAPPASLSSVAACLWTNDAVLTTAQRVVPDGCVDLVWLGGELVIVGADTGPALFESTGGSEQVVGVRLRPGAAGAVLGIPASEVRDARVRASDVWHEDTRSLHEALALSSEDRLDVLARFVRGRGGARDGLIADAARRLSAPDARVARVASDLGVTERQLHRRTLAAVGYGPKVLGRVARLRRLIALSERRVPEPSGVRPTVPLAERALLAGFASQAHMSDEVRRLTGLTPVRFLEDAALTAA